MSAFLAAGVLACAPSSTDSDKLPPTTPDPATVQNERGALAFYHQVVAMLPPAAGHVVVESGVLTDELATLPLPVGQGGPWTGWDSRTTTTVPTLADAADSYRQLHLLRGQAREARGFLATYAIHSDSAYDERDLRAHLYALEGYAEIFLADLYCSGIPLSTVDFQGDYTLTPGFPTAEVYAHAAGLFDSALALIHDSTAQFQPLAAVGKGRALLALGRYAEAEAAVAGVPDGYQFRITDDGRTEIHGHIPLLQAFVAGFTEFGDAVPVMADREGVNGLGYRSDGDPRTRVDTLGTDARGRLVYFPAKYPTSGPIELTLASGVEARLLAAEAALQAGNSSWLTILNALRTDGTYTVNPDDPADTLWHAGTGGTDGLRPLDDPSAAAAGLTRERVDLLFRERAFWLYLTAHREGDLRRLLREYAALGYAPEIVYPWGAYPGGTGVYGDAIVAQVPETERRLNPKYTGCIHLRA